MNFLENGAVLPSGLLGSDGDIELNGFNKTYKNTSLRIGVIVASYPTSDANNVTKLANEYDVLVFEQQEDQGSTVLRYKNCLSMEGLGSIADFFERTLRPQTVKNPNGFIDTSGQNGAVVLILCLDGMGEKGIIVGAVTHPDRKTTLKGTDPHLEGEYNGVHIVVNEDGSTSLTFKGATDGSGKATDATQGPTNISIEKDGSVQIDHKTIIQRLDKNGKASLTANDDISNTTKANFNVTATKNIALTASADFSLSCAKLVANASGSATFACQSISMQSQSSINLQASQFQVQAESMAGIKAANISLDGNVSLGGAGGQPMLTMSALFIGIGNLGIPVTSVAISGFTTKSTSV